MLYSISLSLIYFIYESLYVLIPYSQFSHPSLFLYICYSVSVLYVYSFVLFFKISHISDIGIPRWHSGKESTCWCRRRRTCGFDPWVKKISYSRKWQPTPVFLPRKFHGERRLVINCGKFFKRWEYQTTWPASWEICMQVRKQQLELDTEQQTVPNRKRSTSRLYIVTLLI